MAAYEPTTASSEPVNYTNNPSAAASSSPAVNVGTRRSLLARAQTDIVCKELRKAWPERKYEIHAMATTGDLNQVTALHEFNSKALWTHELEALLEDGRLDMIVHSLKGVFAASFPFPPSLTDSSPSVFGPNHADYLVPKDMPTQLPASLSIGCIFPREDPRDALVVKPGFPYTSLATLPQGATIGTSSVRRSAQLKRLFPHLTFADVRGNVGTRLAKLDAEDGKYTALVLAAAGLLRLGLKDRITAYLSKKEGGILHAVGQGAIGIEVRSDDAEAKTLLDKVGCEHTTMACLAERSLMRTLEGGCSVPIGVETEWVTKKSSVGTLIGTGVGLGAKPAADYDKLTGVAVSGRTGMEHAEEQKSGDDYTGELIMRALVVSLDGEQSVETEMRRVVKTREEADEFGWDVARKLVDGGAEKILHEINLNRKIIEDDGNA